MITCQVRPYLVESTGSRSISKVKLPRAPLVLRSVTSRESVGAVLFLAEAILSISFFGSDNEAV
jgi:hypothetical protein